MVKSQTGAKIMFSVVGKMKCFLCSEEADRLPNQGLEHHLYCKNCGEYNITVQAERVLEFMHEDIKYILSSQTFEEYYYKHKPLTIQTEDIHNAKDITLLEKIYKLSKYLYRETKYSGLGAKINGRYSQFYCKNKDEYIHLLETLKSMNIIEFEKFDGPSGAKGTFRSVYDPPKLSSNAILAFDEGINNIEDFKEVFMTTKKDGDNFIINSHDDKLQINLATGNAKITANQYNSLDIAELNSFIANIINSLPQDISDEKRNEVTENLEFIKTEIQSSNPRIPVIKSIITALKATAGTAGFLASLTQLATYLQL
jgi:hypothetical protein